MPTETLTIPDIPDVPQNPQLPQIQTNLPPDPLAAALLLPLIITGQLILTLTNLMNAHLRALQSSIQSTPVPTGQTTIVNLKYDDKGNIISIFERRF
ncbi:MAG: hypothetical protein DRP15_04040 [Candidatus Aenigmatarchaeota archaeon]|nr:MAG: hypothetical protein DRP15_04040 [Candidatus Aenigmarchaeota archaeon]